MNNITINLTAVWSKSNDNTLTSYPMEIDVYNNSDSDFIMKNIFISVKNEYLLFTTITDIKQSINNITIPPKSRQQFMFDINQIYSRYGSNKKFTIKVIGKNITIESNKTTIDILCKVAEKISNQF